MSRPADLDRDGLLLGHAGGDLSAAQEHALLEAAAVDQDLFDQLMDADAIRSALAEPQERARASAVLRAWEEHAPQLQPETASESQRAPVAALTRVASPRRRSLAAEILRSAFSTLATTVALRLGYVLLAAAGATFVAAPGTTAQGAPALLHLVHAAIAALLLAVQFTGFMKPQTIDGRAHPIARKCLAQFVAGWRCAWALWFALYAWLWALTALGRNPYPVADVLTA